MLKEKEFLGKMAEILETESDSISLDTNFRNDIEDWDSMKGFSIILMLEDDYGVFFEVHDFMKCKTIGELFARVIS